MGSFKVKFLVKAGDEYLFIYLFQGYMDVPQWKNGKNHGGRTTIIISGHIKEQGRERIKNTTRVETLGVWLLRK